MLAAELPQLRNPGHASVLVHDLADDAGGCQTCHPRQVDGRLGLPSPDKHSTFPGSQRKHVSGTCQVGGTASRIDTSQNRAGPVRGGDSGRDALARIYRFAKRRPEIRRILRRNQGQAQRIALFTGQRYADQPPAVRRHEVDDLRSDFFGRDGKIAFILTILVVYDDQYAAGANLLQGLRNRNELHNLIVS